jgi:hypothetical protein
VSAPRPVTRWCAAARYPGATKLTLDTQFVRDTKQQVLTEFRDVANEGGPPYPVEYAAVKVRVIPIDTAGYKP